MLDIDSHIRRTDRDSSKPRTRTEARLKRIARSLLGTFPYHEMTQRLVRKDDTNDTDKDQKCFRRASVRLGESVIKDESVKQDVRSVSALQSAKTRVARTTHPRDLDRGRIKRCVTKMMLVAVGTNRKKREKHENMKKEGKMKKHKEKERKNEEEKKDKREEKKDKQK